jgi:hypothetical protein
VFIKSKFHSHMHRALAEFWNAWLLKISVTTTLYQLILVENCRNFNPLNPELNPIFMNTCGPGSVVGIAIGYGPDGPGIESRWKRDFPAHVQTGCLAHPASCTMGTGPFPGVKSGRVMKLTPHPHLVPWSWKSRTILLLLLWVVRPVPSLSACTRVHFIFTFFMNT